MGLFSSSYKYRAHAGSSSLFEDKPTTLRDSILQSSAARQSISTAVRFALVTDLGARAKAAIKYATKPDGYIRGLPTSDQTFVTLENEVLLSQIQTAVGEPLDSVHWAVIGKPDEAFMVSKHIKEVYNNSTYFPWGVAPDNPVWAEEREFIEIPVIDPTTGKYYITENLPVYERAGYAGGLDYDRLQEIAADEYIRLDYSQLYESKYRVSFAYTDSTGQPAVWDSPVLLDLTSFDTGTWIQARYYTEAIPEYTSYWEYEIGSGLNPAIEASALEATLNAAFMPVIIMMQDKIWYDSDPESQLKITTDKLLKKFAMKGHKIKEDYLEQQAEDDASGDGNKANAEEWDFFIHWAVPIQTRSRGAQEYLYEFFLEMEKYQQYSFEQYQTYLASAKSGPKKGYTLPQPVSELNITEAGINGYNATYGWSYIYSETFPGRWTDYDGNPMEAKKMKLEDFQRKATNEAEYREALEDMHGPGILIGKVNDPDKDNDDKNGYHDYVIITRQHYNEDTGVWSYTRVLAMGLSMKYTINTRDTSDGKKGYRFREAEMGMFNFDDDGNRTEEFRIPVHIGILDRVARVHHEEVIGEAMCATVFLVERIKIKWYQKGFFKWLIVIIAIVLIVLSILFPPLSILSAALVGTTTLTGLLLIMLFVLFTFAMGIIISMAAQTIGEEFGAIWGQLFMIAATIATMYGGGSWGFDTAGMSSWGSAMTLISTTATYANMAVQVYSTYALDKLESDLKDFLKSAKEKYEEIQEAYDQLGPIPNGIDPLDLYRALQIGNAERPDSYYYRTLNANPGLLGYDLINEFSQIALNLPDDTGSMNIIDSQIESFERQRGMV